MCRKLKRAIAAAKQGEREEEEEDPGDESVVVGKSVNVKSEARLRNRRIRQDVVASDSD